MERHSFSLRDYQSKAIDDLWQWFRRHPEGNPIMDCCVSAGKSLMIAATIRRALTEYPETRVIVVQHTKELLEQNLHKLRVIWPEADVGVYSAAFGAKDVGRRITYGTIGSVYKQAHVMGRVHLILCDEAHLLNTKELGMWRTFIADLKRFGNPDVRVIGWTGTPFRNGGVWITAGEDALFTGIAAKVSMRKLLDRGYLSPLVPVSTSTKIDTSSVRIVAGDYNVSDLAAASDREDLVEAACDEIVRLAADRRRWMVFAVNVEHAHHVNDALLKRGVISAVVTGKTPKDERERILVDYHAGHIQCLVNIAVLTTGFDSPPIDFIALLRATQSPTLLIQMCGRGMRLADGKTDCAFADFTDTIATLGPIDTITGRMPKQKRDSQGAPYRLCPECGSQNPTGLLQCIDCGHEFPEPERINHGIAASDAPVLSSQIKNKIVTYPVTDVRYSIHRKPGSPNSLRVDYWSGLKKVASEWVCFEHTGWARAKAEAWWKRRGSTLMETPKNSSEAHEQGVQGFYAEPSTITVNETGKWPEIIKIDFSQAEEIAA